MTANVAQGAEQARPKVRGLPPMLTVEDLAELCRVPVATVYAWNAKGTSPRITRCGKYVRYRQSDVDKWLDAQSTGGGAVA